MKEIIDFAQTVSPLGVIALLTIIIFQLVKGKSIMEVIRGGGTVRGATLDTISQQLTKIAGNHLHELPEMHQNLKTVLADIKDVKQEQIVQGNRITRVETILEQDH